MLFFLYIKQCLPVLVSRHKATHFFLLIFLSQVTVSDIGSEPPPTLSASSHHWMASPYYGQYLSYYGQYFCLLRSIFIIFFHQMIIISY